MKFLDFILDLIYPPLCINCHKILDAFDTTRYLCKECMEAHSFLPITGCKICGRNTSNELCSICIKLGEIPLTKNYSLFNYNNESKSYIFRFKYGLNTQYSKVISKLMYQYIQNNNLFNDIDIVTCVPLHKEKEKKRGFNQSALLAKDISNYLSIPYKKTLVRSKNTIPQSSLSINDRFQNLNSVFIAMPKCNVKDKNILIIDDIYTSGSTIIQCSKVLKECGARDIYSLTLSLAHNKV